MIGDLDVAGAEAVVSAIITDGGCVFCDCKSLWMLSFVSTEEKRRLSNAT